MASFSNLAFDTIRRLKNDETGEITLVFTRDGVPLNIADLRFSVGFNVVGSVEEIVRLEEGGAAGQLIRPTGTTDRLVIDLTPEQREDLEADSYTIWVYLLVSGRRDPIVYYKFSWEIEPMNSFLSGQPREPAPMRIDFVTASALTLTVPVYELGGTVTGAVPGVASEAAATASPLPAGAGGQLLLINEQPFIRVGTKLLGLSYTTDDV
ncbi:hypothetical protein [Fibrivirga algicola]|uniref:Uncharacterized protein n=1 Tax=Fibrivirga algicola TaxID=2950420 RepID=A0ABX0QMV2_9BACT|nr:hypothetical protein [Fibrivirga algicola]NID13790.1 hypothetical protein [Fibrivirga algicola]